MPARGVCALKCDGADWHHERSEVAYSWPRCGIVMELIGTMSLGAHVLCAHLPNLAGLIGTMNQGAQTWSYLQSLFVGLQSVLQRKACFLCRQARSESSL
jgi:hypothetical protein